MQKQLLLAEDDPTLLQVLKTKLENEGFFVHPASNGKEAIHILQEKHVDLALMDVLMPEIGGFDVIESMKENPKLQHIPVIIISNSGQPVEIHRAIRMGVCDYLIKAEFDPQEVIEKVYKHLKKAS